jgi:hypothetical protein
MHCLLSFLPLCVGRVKLFVLLEIEMIGCEIDTYRGSGLWLAQCILTMPAGMLQINHVYAPYLHRKRYVMKYRLRIEASGTFTRAVIAERHNFPPCALAILTN